MPGPRCDHHAVTSAFPELPDVGQPVELLTRVRDEDDDAWTELYRKYHDGCCSSCG
jgi:hypothetical protein